MEFMHANGVVLHYSDSGGDGPAIVFSNSLGTDFRIWDRVAPHFAATHRIIRYDKRGHGLSEAPPAPYRMGDHVADLAALLDQRKVRGAVVVGLSVGGVIAQGLAAIRPGLVSALVLSNTAHKIGTTDSWNARIAAVTSGGLGSIADAVMKLWFTPQFRDPANAAFMGCRNMLVRTPVEGYAGTCAALRDADMTDSTRALKLPVLCIAGDQDGSTPPDLVRSMAELIGGSQFRVVDDAGHIPCMEQPDAVVTLIRQFLRHIPHQDR